MAAGIGGFLLVLQLVFCPFTLAAPLFESDEMIEVELLGPITTLIKDTAKRQEQRLVLRAEGREYAISARVRGKSRSRVCRFPPLRLDFGGADTAASVFQGQEKLKLVTHCINDKRGDMNVMEEYAAYRMFNLLSALSYRVRILRISYKDTDGRLPKSTDVRYGFLIEPARQLQERTGGILVQLKGVKPSKINEQQALLVYVFQFMIGNTDWSFARADLENACCHNGDLLEIDGKLNYVPFDFDQAGLVNAGYARPDSSLRLKNVRLRRYRGFCVDRNDLQQAIRVVKSQQQEVMAVLPNISGYPDNAVRYNSKFLARFFELAEDEEALLDSYEKRCLDYT